MVKETDEYSIGYILYDRCNLQHGFDYRERMQRELKCKQDLGGINM